MKSEPTGVQIDQRRYVVPGKPLRKPLIATPVGPAPRDLPYHNAGDLRTITLGVLIVDSVVADLRSCHDHYLATVGRVGEDLLVARHVGIEDDFSDSWFSRSDQTAGKKGSVLKEEEPFWGLQWEWSFDQFCGGVVGGTSPDAGPKGFTGDVPASTGGAVAGAGVPS